MFDMWSSVTSKLEAHANNLGQSNVQSPAGQNNSSGSIKGKASLIFQSFQINKYNMLQTKKATKIQWKWF